MQQTSYRLVAFDVDGTLIGSRDGRVVWQFLNQRFGGDAEVNARRFRAYLDKKITYAEWVELDVGQWVAAGATREQIVEEILRRLYLLPGARETVETLNDRGFRLAVISGTIDLVLELLYPQHPFDEVFTNRIWFDDSGQIAGWEATPFDMEGKARALAQIAGRLGIDMSQTVYVGDNLNDIQVMGVAGLAIAYDPKHSSVGRAADAVVHKDLRRILELI
jgi:HAD superfamily PSPase-like hydrolase